MKKKWAKRLTIVDGLVLALLVVPLVYAVDAPSGFDNLTNGFTTQAQFDLDLATFEEFETIDDGLGPVYNAQSCRECHQNPVTGANSQVTELRVARFDGFFYTDRPGGSLINDRAINAAIQERVAGADNVATFRSSLNILGDGFVEAIPDSFFTNTRNGQPSGMKGTIINVPVLEAAAGTTRIGRFGWKNQHASLLSFAADAYLNEMGITSVLQPTENTSNGTSVASFDGVADPEDATSAADPKGIDVSAFTRFMRSTKTPPRDAVLAATSSAIAGASLFNSVGCNICHVANITTAPAGTLINGNTLTVSAAIGGKTIHPYSDFMLHDVGTGDGIVQNGGQTTANKLRTPPLWGVRTSARHMHQGQLLTFTETILQHAGEATTVINRFRNLSATQRNQIVVFLQSL